MDRPDLIRTWCSDTIGTFDPDYIWHENAQIWQRSGDGEQWVAQQLALSSEQRAENLRSRGMQSTIATEVAKHFDERMGACILSLYRSSAQPTMAQLGNQLPAAATRPGLAIVATEDHFVGTDQQRLRSARRAGARAEILEGCGHWWMTEAGGEAGAAALDRFWSSVHGGYGH
jgi:pimeloyl-ACP methyl ester carboxylesterase